MDHDRGATQLLIGAVVVDGHVHPGVVATLPITIYPGMPIGQLAFFALDAPAEHP